MLPGAMEAAETAQGAQRIAQSDLAVLPYADVAVAVPVPGPFVYRVPAHLAAAVVVGRRVKVGFGRRSVTGWVLGLRTEKPGDGKLRIREIDSVDESEPPVGTKLLELLLFASRHYLVGPGEMLKTALPSWTEPKASKRSPKKAASAQENADAMDRSSSDVGEAGEGREKRLILTPEQDGAVAAIVGGLEAGGYHGFLLHGVTGSGKTEVYLRAIEHVRQAGRGAIVLVPEIALTPQLAGRFRGRFGDAVVVLHSGLRPTERRQAWRRLEAGEATIALGARSAVFAPMADLGIIVVDEEHDPSYKQEEGVRYHGRDMALMRAHQAGAVAVLGSATPSLEAYLLSRPAQADGPRSGAAAAQKKLTSLELTGRAAGAMPAVEIIDLKIYQPDKEALVSAPLLSALEKTIAEKEQAILFVNRRGFAQSLLCTGCGQAVACRNCSVALPYHRDGGWPGVGRSAKQDPGPRPRDGESDRGGQLVCHYCGFARPRPRACPSCGSEKLRLLGAGTERVTERLKALLPHARIARFDRDVSRKVATRNLLARFGRGEIDILVGTQMVAKGHDFPGVTLVGVLLAEMSLAWPDFRASERTFQLLEQVAGRAGRRNRPDGAAGRVLVQTYRPDHPAITLAAKHDYHAFAALELAARAELGYPPEGYLVVMRLDGKDTEQVRQGAVALAAKARELRNRDAAGTDFELLGPSEAPIARLRGRVRYQVILRGPDRKRLRHVAAAVRQSLDLPASVRLIIDVDPLHVL